MDMAAAPPGDLHQRLTRARATLEEANLALQQNRAETLLQVKKTRGFKAKLEQTREAADATVARCDQARVDVDTLADDIMSMAQQVDQLHRIVSPSPTSLQASRRSPSPLSRSQLSPDHTARPTSAAAARSADQQAENVAPAHRGNRNPRAMGAARSAPRDTLLEPDTGYIFNR